MIEVMTRRVNGVGMDAFPPIGRVRVWPASEDIRRYIKHPNGNLGFRSTMQESVEWPFDAFTKRRLRDGDVLDHPVVEATAVEATDVMPESDPGPLATDNVGMPVKK